MKRFFVIFICVMMNVSLFAQEDIYGVRVTQSGNFYKATLDKKSDNGGSASESWSGTLLNGRREGTWKFSGKYNLYGPNNSVFWTGSVTIIKNYKNGIPHGVYQVNDNLNVRGGGYNVFTGQWVYRQPQSENATITGSFENGKMSGTWNVNAKHTKFVATFNNGMPNGKFSYTNENGLTTTATFKDGYVVTMKEMQMDNQWWFETSYHGKDPKTIYPQDTSSVFRINFLLPTLFTGVSMGADYFTKYPANASDDNNISAPFIISDASNYRKPVGNVPADVYGALEHMKQEKEYNALAVKSQEMSEKLSKIVVDIRFKIEETTDPLFYGFLKRHHLANQYEKKLVREEVLANHPELGEFAKYMTDWKDKNKRTLTSDFVLEYERNIQSTFDADYQKVYDKALQQVIDNHGTDNDSTRYYIYKYYSGGYQPKEWTAYLYRLRIAHKRATFEINEEDIQMYLLANCIKCDVPKTGNIYSSASPTYKYLTKDASYITKDDVFEFAFEWSDENGKRLYDSVEMKKKFGFSDLMTKELERFKTKRKFIQLRETVPF